MQTARIAAQELNNQQESTDQPGIYLQEWLEKCPQNACLPETILIILDIDDTVLTTPHGQWLGSSAMFYGLLAETQQQYPGWTRKQAAEHIDVLLSAIYPRVPLQLTDTSLPQTLHTLRDKGFRVSGMTSRGLGVKDVTLWQLQQANIEFMGTQFSSPHTTLNEPSIRIESGVVFVGHGNTKGDILKKLLAKEPQFQNIEKVIVIDDRQKHLDDIQSSVTDREIVTVLCSYPQSRVPYNNEQGRVQMKAFLEQWRDDAVIGHLINNDRYTQSLL
ncbi:DUF2608 domain-containing protein [Parendozoicomonas sp. Alg238-R29]|uniref:DUF2608 domain-containing protein n=1 Tax=Parendozoicomonas sp. Alg238-R29 TaxID=2993446 RepID=UPI00248E8E47|nr:DUF2608 domain-containing protein [Parendozoicomonas sp. Alg238-R29]